MTRVEAAAPEAFEFSAADGYRLQGRLWCPLSDDGSRPAVVICCATGVAARYYGRFAAWLATVPVGVLTAPFAALRGAAVAYRD